MSLIAAEMGNASNPVKDETLEVTMPVLGVVSRSKLCGCYCHALSHSTDGCGYCGCYPNVVEFKESESKIDEFTRQLSAFHAQQERCEKHVYSLNNQIKHLHEGIDKCFDEIDGLQKLVNRTQKMLEDGAIRQQSCINERNLMADHVVKLQKRVNILETEILSLKPKGV